MTEPSSAAPAAQSVVSGRNPKATQASAPVVPDYKGTKHWITTEGREIEVDYDELRRGYGHNQAANQRLAKAAEIAKAAKERHSYADGLIKRFDDPRDALGLLTEKFGRDKAKEVFEGWLIEQMDYDALPEGERRARELEKSNKTLEEQLKEERSAKEEARKADIEKKAHADIDEEVGAALRKIGRTPTPRLAIRVVDEMIMRGSKERVPADKAVEYAQKGIEADLVEYLEEMSPEDAFAKLPKKFLQALRQYEVQQVLGDKQQRRPKTKTSEPLSKPGERLTLEEKFDRLKGRVAKHA